MPKKNRVRYAHNTDCYAVMMKTRKTCQRHGGEGLFKALSWRLSYGTSPNFLKFSPHFWYLLSAGVATPPSQLSAAGYANTGTVGRPA